MFLSSLVTIGLLVSPTTSIFESRHYLSCEDYVWVVRGVEKSELISEVQRSEIRLELIEATDPVCFE
jgi:hypothetical protein